MTDPHKPIETVFNAAKALGPNDQKAYLDMACKGDAALRQEVERLLAAASAADGFFETRPAGSDDSGITLADTTVREGPGTVIGRYKLLQQIGEGGMGVVYMAEQTEPVVRKVALKIIKLGMDTKAVVARFEAERQALALMDHPNIAKVLDAGATDTGRPYFVMELVRGIPITEYCDKNHLSARRRLELFIPVCQAIQHAHQKGIIHRDIKPSNILVTLHDSQPLPMVIDFGIAKATNQKLTEKTLFTNFAQVIGTPAYMSPEQAEMTKLDVDTRTDIYSLGVLLYELLTGTTPFTAKELMEAGYAGMQRIIAEQEPPRPSTRLSIMQQSQRTTVAQNRRMEPSALTRLFQGDLDWIVMKCLEKERARRYETASALAADLHRHLESEPVVARPPTLTYRLGKAIRRNRLAFAAGGAVALALVLGLGASTWQAVRATRAERQQQVALRLAAEASKDAEQRERERAESGERRTDQLLYAANMKLAQAAWNENNLGLVRRLLGETADSPHRGFEWYYWYRQTHREALVLRGHQAGILAAIYSPDGSRIATGGRDGTARIWDAKTGTMLLTLHTVSPEVEAIAFSPDGHRLATGSWADQRLGVPASAQELLPTPAQVWDIATGKEVLRLKGHVSGVCSVGFSPDGRSILTGGVGNMSGELNAFLGFTNARPTADGSVRIWNAATGEETLVLQGKNSDTDAPMWSATFSPDGRRVATITRGGEVAIWDTSSGEVLTTLKVEIGTKAMVSSPLVRFFPDGHRVVTTGDEAATVWNVDTGEVVFTLPSRASGVLAVAVSRDGRRIATGDSDSVITVWDASTGRKLRTFPKLHGGEGINCVAFSEDGRRLVTAALDMSNSETEARVWDLDPPADSLPIQELDDQARNARWSPDGRRIVTISTNGTLRVWEASTRRLLAALGQPKPTFSGFSSDGARFATRGGDGTFRICETDSGKQAFQITGHGTNGIQTCFSSFGDYVATISPMTGVLKVWGISSGKEVAGCQLQRERALITALSPKGDHLVSQPLFEATNVAWIIDAARGVDLVALRGHRSDIGSASFSRDGTRLVTGSADYTAKIWDTKSGRELLTLLGHGGSVRSAAFTFDESRILTASDDRTIRLWDAVTGKELLILTNEKERPSSPCISPDGTRILATLFADFPDTGRSPVLHVWEAATPEQVAGWRLGEPMETQQRAGFPGAGTESR